MKSFYCLINDRSGGGAGIRSIRSLQQLIAVGKLHGKVVAIDFSNLDRQLAEAKQFDLLLIGGGDGTISSLLRAIRVKTSDDPNAPPIGLIPLGTGNDLARELGIYKIIRRSGLEALIERYEKASARDLDIWAVCYGSGIAGKEGFSERIEFVNYLSFGFDGAVIRDFHDWRERGWFGNSAGRGYLRGIYGLSGLRNLRTFAPRGKISGRGPGNTLPNIEASFNSVRSLLVTQIQSVMGLGRSNEVSSPFDRLIEIVGNRSLISYLGMICNQPEVIQRGLFFGSQESWEIEFELEQGELLCCQVDGEWRPEITGRRFRIERAGSVKLLTP